MNLSDLKQYAWKHLGVRKHLAGRRAVDDLVEIAVQNWEPDYIRQCVNNGEVRNYEVVMLGHMKRMYQVGGEYGTAEFGFIWVFILSSIASALIRMLIEWWLKSGTNRVFMEILRRELNQ